MNKTQKELAKHALDYTGYIYHQSLEQKNWVWELYLDGKKTLDDVLVANRDFEVRKTDILGVRRCLGKHIKKFELFKEEK